MTLALAAALLAYSVQAGAQITPAANALPTGGQVVAGQASINASGSNTLTIQQQSQNAAINWQSFNIGTAASVSFVQPSASSIALNRVLGQDPTQILGNLSANGQVFILNPNGVLFGKGAQVNVGGLVASTLGLSDTDFMAGRYGFSGNGGPLGSVVNAGDMIANGGYVALLGPQVSNQGTIIATSGNVSLAAGERITLNIDGNRLVGLAVDQGTLNAQAANGGLIKADGGAVLLTAKAMDAVVKSVVNNQGVIEADTLTTVNGTIRLVAEGGDTTVGGSLLARGAAAGAHGGDIAVSGSTVALTSAAVADASGAAGGGSLLIGGNYQGQGPLAHAHNTSVATGALLLADALDQGNGGQVVVWADGVTAFGGRVSAVGGVNGGNGGTAEVSGGQVLNFLGTVDLRAPLGSTGSLLLDPRDIVISSGTDDTSQSGGNPDTFTANSSISILNNAVLNTALNSANVIVDATSGSGGAGTIAVNAPVSGTAGKNLTLTAASTITVNNTIGLGTGTLALLTSGGDITATAAAITAGGLTLQTGASGTVTLQGAAHDIGTIQTTGAGIGSGGLTFRQARAGGTTLGPITAAGNISIQDDLGPVTVSGAVTAPDISLTADQINITAAVNATTSISLAPATAGTTITVGNHSAPAGLIIDNTELGLLSAAPTLNIGNATSGPVQFGYAQIRSPTLDVTTAGGVTESATGNLIVSGGTGALNIVAGGTVNLSSPGIAMGSLSGSTTSGDFLIALRFCCSGSPLSVTGITTAGGDIVVQNSSGNLTVNGPISSRGGNVLLGTGNALGGTDAQLILNADVNAGAGSIGLSASASSGAAGIVQNAGKLVGTNLVANMFGPNGLPAASQLLLNSATNAISDGVALGTSESSSRNISFTDSIGFTVGGILGITYASLGGASLFANGIQIPLGTLSLTAGGNVSQPNTSQGALVAHTLNLARLGTANPTFTLDKKTVVDELGTVSLGTGALTLADFKALTITGPITAGNVSIMDGLGPLTVSGAITAPNVSLTADQMNINAAVNATSSISLAPATAGTSITVGDHSSAPAGLIIDNTELGLMSAAPTLNIGNATSGPVQFGFAQVSSAALDVTTAGGVTQNDTFSLLSVGGANGTLNITAGGTVNLNMLGIGVGAVGGSTTSGDFLVTQHYCCAAPALSVTGITTAGGDVFVSNLAGNMTVDGPISSHGGNVMLGTANSVGGSSTQLILNADVNAGAGSIALNSNAFFGGPVAIVQNAGALVGTNLIGFLIGGSGPPALSQLLLNSPTNAISGGVALDTVRSDAPNITFADSLGFTVGGLLSISNAGQAVPVTGLNTGILSGTLTINAGGPVSEPAGARGAIQAQTLNLARLGTANPNITLNNIDIGQLGTVSLGSGALALSNLSALTITGAATTGAYSVTTVGKALTQNAGATIDTSATNGTISLNIINSTADLTLNGSLLAGSGMVTLGATGSVKQNAGGITAGSLQATATVGAVDLTAGAAANNVATLTGSANGNFTYADANSTALTIGTGAFNAPGITSTTGDVSVTASKAGSTLTVASPVQAAAAGGDITLLSGGNLALIAAITANSTDGVVSLTSTGASVVESTVGNSSGIVSSAKLAASAAANVDLGIIGGNTAGAGGFAAKAGTGFVSFVNSTAVKLDTVGAISGVTAGGPVFFGLFNGDFTQSAAGLVTAGAGLGVLTFKASLILDQANNISGNFSVFGPSATANVTFHNTGAINVDDVGVVGADAAYASAGISASTAAGGFISLTSDTGTITQGARAINAITGGELRLQTAGKNVTLDNAANKITTLGTVSLGAGALKLVDSTGGLTVSGPVTAGSIDLTTSGGAASVTGPIAVTGTAVIDAGANDVILGNTLSAGAAGDALQIHGGRFINNVGANALSTPNGRWLVWSTNPANDTRGGLAYNFKQYSATYGVTTPAQATGNGLLYTLAPVITPLLTGTVAKTYDGSTAATLTAANYSATGAVDGDTIVFNNPAAGSYDNRNAGSGKQVSVNGITLTGVTNGAAKVYGYTLGSSSAQANIGRIDPRVLAGASIAAGASVYGSALTPSVVSFTNVVAGDTVASAASVNTGATSTAGKPVVGSYTQAAGTALTGADAGNYSFAGFTSAANYTISPFLLSVAYGDVDKVYDGTPSASVTTSDNRYAGDLLTINRTAAFADSNIATGKTVNVTAVSLGGADAGNYSVAPTGSATASITPQPPAVSADDTSMLTGALASVESQDHSLAKDPPAVSTGGVTVSGPGVNLPPGVQ